MLGAQLRGIEAAQQAGRANGSATVALRQGEVLGYVSEGGTAPATAAGAEPTDVATVVTGTLIWLVLFLAQLPFYGWFADHGHTWWLWTCAVGAALGCVGIWYVKAREKAIKQADDKQAQQDR